MSTSRSNPRPDPHPHPHPHPHLTLTLALTLTLTLTLIPTPTPNQVNFWLAFGGKWSLTDVIVMCVIIALFNIPLAVPLQRLWGEFEGYISGECETYCEGLSIAPRINCTLVRVRVRVRLRLRVRVRVRAVSYTHLTLPTIYSV